MSRTCRYLMATCRPGVKGVIGVLLVSVYICWKLRDAGFLGYKTVTADERLPEEAHKQFEVIKLPVTNSLSKKESPEEAHMSADVITLPVSTSSKEEIPYPLNGVKIRLLSTNPELCEVDDLKAIAFVLSRPDNAQARAAVRAAYGSGQPQPLIRVAFMMGQSQDREVNREVLKENTEHGDLVIGDYLDTYYNLTLKLYTAMYWVDQYCSHSPITIKTDDDIEVNIANLQQFLLTRPDIREKNDISKVQDYTVNGSFYCHYQNTPVIRNPNSKWYVSYEEWVDENFPQFCKGAGYLFDTVVAPLLWRGASTVGFLKLEDVFFTGIVRRKYRIEINSVEIVDEVAVRDEDSPRIFRHTPEE